jgi:alkaline phosphatase D
MDRMISRILYFLLFFSASSAIAQSTLLQSGPMVGYADKDKVLLWVQTNSPAIIKFKYWDSDYPDVLYYTREDSAKSDNGFVSKVFAQPLLPGKLYQYELLINDKAVSLNYPLRFHSQPLHPPDTFKVALGSCASFSEDDEVNRIFLSIADKKPDLMIWLGDNVYLMDEDWESKKTLIEAYTKQRSLAQMQALLGSVHNYAIWDDHDYGPDNSDSTFCYKNVSKEVFEMFWGNPSFGIEGKGVSTSWCWSKVQFFLMDNRSFRAPNRPRKRTNPYFGKMQVDWLIDSLKKCTSDFKLIATGNQMLPTGFIPGEAYSKYRREKKYLLRRIEKENIKGVIFISGDRHFSELSREKRKGTYPLYELTVSPLTSTAITREFNFNYWRVNGTFVGKRNFSLLEFFKGEQGRQVRIGIYDSKGKVLWQKIIGVKDLS